MADDYAYHISYAHERGFGNYTLHLHRKIRTHEDLEACRVWLNQNAKVGEVSIITWKRFKGKKVKEVENGNAGA